MRPSRYRDAPRCGRTGDPRPSEPANLAAGAAAPSQRPALAMLTPSAWPPRCATGRRRQRPQPPAREDRPIAPSPPPPSRGGGGINSTDLGESSLDSAGSDTASRSHGSRGQELGADPDESARILLKADVSDAGEGWSDSAIAAALDTSIDNVARTRQQLVEEGFEATLTRKYNPNSARPRIRRRRGGGETDRSDVLAGFRMGLLVGACVSSKRKSSN